jgi:hypothetical protein
VFFKRQAKLLGVGRSLKQLNPSGDLRIELQQGYIGAAEQGCISRE